MKKLSDKIISLVCCTAMVLITCFGVSYKFAHKTYASDLTPITEKQRLGAFLSSLAFSCGVRVYIATVGTYEWLVDNFNSVMLRLQFAMSANDVYQNAVDNYDNENKTYKLDPEFTKAVQEYLKFLQGEGINEYSGTVEIGSYEETNEGSYMQGLANQNQAYGEYMNGNQKSYFIFKTTKEVRVMSFLRDSNPRISFYAVSLEPFKYTATTSSNINVDLNPTNTADEEIVNGVKYYYFSNSQYLSTGTNPISYAPSTSYISSSSERRLKAIALTYGSEAITGGTETFVVNGKPNPYWSDTEVTLDRDAEYKVDYSDTDGAEETSTLDELIQLINELIDTGTEEQLQTIPKVDVQIFTPTIDPTTVDIPTLFDGIPEIITPECVGLGSCLVSGVQTASQHLQNIYESNSSVANYTMVSLAIGIALYILTGGI